MYPAQSNTVLSLRVMGVIAVLLGGLGGLMTLTNPSPKDFNLYATDTIQYYLKNDLCMQVAEQLNGAISSYCKTVVDAGRPQIATILDHSTVRHNYLFFSIYVTTLQLPAPIPHYQFETVGVLDQFFVFEQQEI
jgi:uncharacterized protein YceK